MAKYHLKENGEPGKCSARVRPCPLGASKEEHYGSKGEARAAYEESMEINSALQASQREVTPEVSEVEKVDAARLQEENAADSAEVMAILDSMATPEAVAEWRNAPTNSFRWRLTRILDAQKEGMHGYTDPNEVGSMVMMLAAGARSGASQQIRDWTKQLIEAEVAEEMNARYHSMLADVPLEPTSTPRYVTPYSPKPGAHTPEVLREAIETAHGELNFVEPLCRTYDRRFFPDSPPIDA